MAAAECAKKPTELRRVNLPAGAHRLDHLGQQVIVPGIAQDDLFLYTADAGAQLDLG